MIRITQQSNIKCLKCNCTPELLVHIGVYYMCTECFEDEFPTIKSAGINTNNKKLMKVYHKWLQIYLQRSEDSYFDTN